jgi:type II secretory pathway pseudopilin PulG
MKHVELGQSILEILFATAVVALVLVAVLSTIIASLRNSRTSLEQTRATNYANEALEWFRKERDTLGWAAFSQPGPGVGATQTYCFATYPSGIELINTVAGVCESTQTIPDSVFRREVLISRLTPDDLTVTVTIFRPSREGETATVLQGRFSQWQ